MPDAPVFSLEAVNALVPRLNALVGEQIERRGRIEAKLSALSTLLGDTPDDLDPVAEDSDEVAALRGEARELVVSYRDAWRELEKMGAVVKDSRRGLLDFYGRVEGQLVWLCWQFGEAEISHYHKLEEGFPGRKPIEPAAKQRLLN
jgi:hypothetical protein